MSIRFSSAGALRRCGLAASRFDQSGSGAPSHGLPRGSRAHRIGFGLGPGSGWVRASTEPPAEARFGSSGHHTAFNPMSVCPRKRTLPTPINMSTLCQRRTLAGSFARYFVTGPTSPDARRLYNHWHLGKPRQYSASAADRYPLVEKNLQGAPHCHPADDQHALSENIRSAVIAKGGGQFPQQHAAKQEAQTDEQRDAAIAEQQP